MKILLTSDYSNSILMLKNCKIALLTYFCCACADSIPFSTPHCTKGIFQELIDFGPIILFLLAVYRSSRTIDGQKAVLIASCLATKNLAGDHPQNGFITDI